MRATRCRVSISRVGYRGAKLVLIALVAYGCVNLLINNYAYYHDYARIVATLSNHTGGLRQESPSQMFLLDGVKVNLTLVEELVAKYRFDLDKPLPEGEGQNPWALPEKWATVSQVLPEYTPDLGGVLKAMVTTPIVSIGPTNDGQQPKFNITLRGGQVALFKPQWYRKDIDWRLGLCSIPDNAAGEVASFHLSRVLEFRKTPLAVSRTLNVKKEIIPLVSKALPNTFYEKDNKTCFFFDCPKCEKIRSLCVGDTMEGVVILWLPTAISLKIRPFRHPWGHPCHLGDASEYLKANYCIRVRQRYPYNVTNFFLDLVDATIFQYLTANADRIPFQVYDGRSVAGNMMVMLDNGKTFQHPDRDEPRLLAPLNQCCFVRKKTYQRLQLLSKGVLSRVMKAVLSADPLSPVLTDRHLNALDRRVGHVLYEIEKCIIEHDSHSVLSV